MIKIEFAVSFVRNLRRLTPTLIEESLEKIELFKNNKNHKQLKVHKLKGRLLGRYSFSVNYKTRIVFSYASKNTAILLAIGDHDVYK